MVGKVKEKDRKGTVENLEWLLYHKEKYPLDHKIIETYY